MNHQHGTTGQIYQMKNSSVHPGRLSSRLLLVLLSNKRISIYLFLSANEQNIKANFAKSHLVIKVPMKKKLQLLI